MSMRAILSMTTTAASMICAIACTGTDPGTPAGLPDGWESASRIEDFVQSPCSGSPYEGAKDAARFSSVDGRIHVDYEPAHFRCDQDVEGFIKVEAANADVLVQPVDMDPSSVAKCDCLYSIDIELSIAPGSHQVTLYRRWDHKSGADAPVRGHESSSRSNLG